ncbi:unnamed protein product [Protopolystoma xenopodis]|uniref:Uncharacterized protein n=1 Tax=Protopolystoma xenopodis TaxID=117903 RepID=A0A3S5B017_9PLAT|nr:unnamed protein product [Protopolystoma xenopodis]
MRRSSEPSISEVNCVLGDPRSLRGCGCGCGCSVPQSLLSILRLSNCGLVMTGLVVTRFHGRRHIFGTAVCLPPSCKMGTTCALELSPDL